MSERKLIIFDFDGTLIDSKPHYAAGLKEFSEGKGLAHDIEKMSRGYVDPTVHDLGWNLSLAEQISVMDEFTDYMNAQTLVYKRFIADLFPHVQTVLNELNERYDLALITVRDRATTLATLEFHGLKNMFPAYRTHCCAKDRNYRIKPHPDALFCLIKDTGHKPENIIMIGDTTSDIDMAHAASVRSIAALWGMHDKDRLLAAKPTVALKNAKELPQTIATIFQV